MSKVAKEKKKTEKEEQKLLEVSEKLVLEHPTYKELAKKLLEEEQKSGEYKNNWLSTQAELENFKRRAERDVVNAHKYGLEKFAGEVLATVDNLERSLMSKPDNNEALKDFYMGIELTLKSLLEVLEKFEIKSIIPEIGEAFDPDKHTAMSAKEDGAAKPNTVLEVIQKGYWLKDRLLRPTLVVVAK